MATVIQEESPWTQLLGGVGQGLSEGVKIGMAKKQQEIDLEKEILFGTASGKYNPLIWASKSGQEFLTRAKLHERPAIKELVRSGLSLLPQGDTAQATPGGGAVNVPQADLSVLGPGFAPSDREVQDLIEAEDMRKKLDLAKKESDLIFGRSVALEAIRTARMQGVKDPVELMNATRQAMMEAGVNLDDYSITTNSKGQISINFNTDATSKKITPNKAIELGEEFDRQVSAAFNKRTQNIRSLSGILAGDVSLASADVDPNDAVAVALKQAAELISNTKGSQQRIMERASRVKTILTTLNDEIAMINRAIENAGKRSGRDLDLIEKSKIRPVTFEDVSGGVKIEDWLKERTKEQTPSKDLISDIRSTPLENRSVAGAFGVKSQVTDADKLKRVYEGLKGAVETAIASNPHLTSDVIKSNIVGMKREIMAEYQLNERLWSMLVQMADRVMG